MLEKHSLLVAGDEVTTSFRHHMTFMTSHDITRLVIFLVLSVRMKT